MKQACSMADRWEVIEMGQESGGVMQERIDRMPERIHEEQERIVEVNEMQRISSLFEGWQETLIYSCLQGIMGKAYARSLPAPRAAQILIGDFCFFAGEPQEDLAAYKPGCCGPGGIIMVPRNEAWAKLIEQIYGRKAVRITRYAIKKEPDVFDCRKLEKFAQGLSSPFVIRQIDRSIYEQAMGCPWSRDLCSQFIDYEDYAKRGLGFAVLEGDVIVSGASSYTVYQNGIEIEIDTKKEYRRRGLALACGARLVLACLKRGWYPSWDAHNLGSVALAERLGYHFDREYTAYEVEW